MTTGFMTIIRVVVTFFIFLFFPCTSYLQEQKDLAIPQQEQVSSEPAQQESGQLITPNEASPNLEDTIEGQNDILNESKEPQRTSGTSPEGSRTYTIKKGDTLWDISGSFLRDPFLWPFIWKANPSINNPDLIYPGNKLAIPNLAPIERALKAPTGAETKEELPEKKIEEPQMAPEARQPAEAIESKPVSPTVADQTPPAKSIIIVPEEQPIPIIDKYAMLSAGFVNASDMNGTIVGSPFSEKSIYGFGDTVFVKFSSTQSVHVGDKFLIYKILHKVDDPVTGKRFGNLIRGTGILQITAMDTPSVLTAQITLSFDSVEKNDQVTPYQEPALIFNSTQRKVKNISGHVLEVTDYRHVNGQLDFVYLNRGIAEGVELGDRFTVYKKIEEKTFPKVVSGEVRVFIVKEHTATAVITNSIDAIERGDEVQFKK